MRITVRELRRIINEVMKQDSVPPGRWTAHSVEPAKPDDIERLGETETTDEEEESEDQTW